MNQNNLDYNLIARMLKEFVVEHSGKWVHPDICDKGAASIETLLSENEKLKAALMGTCSACKHATARFDTSCNVCLRNHSDSGYGIQDNWEWNPDLDSPSPTSNAPLPMEALHGMAGKPYWHVGLRPESEPPHWAILPDMAAKYPQDYHYGEYWLAYLQETENKEADDENPDA